MKNIFIKVFLVSTFYNFRGNLLKEALKIIQTSFWQSLKPISMFWDFILRPLGQLVSIKWRRVLFRDLKQVGFWIRFARLIISFISEKWFFEESKHGLNSSMFKSPAKMILSYLPNILLRLTESSSKNSSLTVFGDRKQKECTTFS